MTLRTATCCVMALLPLVSTNAAAQKPVREATMSVLYKEPPPTLEGLAAASDTVVVLRVDKTGGTKSGLPVGTLFTEISATIVDVPKLSPHVGPPGAALTFFVHGGEIDRGDYIEHVVNKGQPPLLPRHEYLVALTWDQTEQAFFPAFGPGSIFEVVGDRIVPQRQTALAAHVQSLTAQQALAKLKGR